ncbi:hypothetical protein [Arenimonas metalli]|uniref:Outer membrane protein beta-barrel domain-containing protein n=1 Tax=Arenimonas metalli CF5-1 TaxID=1384056 RepID=A0A091B4L0_9GAMM|nr:hypothetical protein [Arenimonas metalli]KFN46452.1 hypothetical protein N787_10505 [Arenimonas metalli CF5-1]
MKTLVHFRACAATITAILAAAPAAAQEGATTGEWTGQVTPYVWGSGLGGTLTPFAGAPTVRIDKSFSEVLEDSDGAFFLSAFARRDRLVLLGDFSYAASSNEGVVPPGLPAEGSLRQTSLTLAAGWRVHEGERVAFDLLGGLRHWDVNAAVAVPLIGVARSPGDSFTDPIFAARANVSLSPRWSVIGYADVGGFGVGSDGTHQWLVVANYAGSDRWVFSAGLRALSVDYREGGTRVDARLAGPLVGASWRF